MFNKRKTKFSFFALILMIMFLMLSCDDGSSGSDKSDDEPEISSGSCILENIDPGWWSTEAEGSAYFNIRIEFLDTELRASDFESIRFIAPDDSSWLFEDDSLDNYFNEDSAVFGGWVRCWSSNWEGGDYIQLGDYTIELTLDNGESVSYSFNIPSPGSLTTGSKIYAYTEDYTGTVGTSGINLPKRANIDSASQDGTTLTVTFNVNDSLIYNGFLWFYDVNGDYIGSTSSTYFRDYSTGAISSNMNSGSAFYIEGTDNTVSYTAADCNMNDGNGISDISTVCVVLTDGYQYENQESSYDCRSITAEYTVTFPAAGVSTPVIPLRELVVETTTEQTGKTNNSQNF